MTTIKIINNYIDETTRTAAFQEAFKMMERVKTQHTTESKIDENAKTLNWMQGKAREKLSPRILAAGHVPPLWWGDGA